MEIKVFVVDDEERQRHSIVRHVEWERYRMRVIGEAEDADGALQRARVCPPDLLITDIRLLGASGLELSSRMREINPRLRIIIMTGYEEFQYAKSALDIGVDAFLMKPILFDDLHDILDRIYRAESAELSKNEEERRLLEQLDTFRPIAQHQFVQELLHGLVVGEAAIRARAATLGLFAVEGPRRVLTLVIDTSPSSSSPAEEQLRLVQEKMERTAEAVCGALLERTTTTRRGNIVLILRGGEAADFESATDGCVRQLQAELESIRGFSVRIGIGPQVSGPDQLSESFRLAQRAASRRLLGGAEAAYSWNLPEEQGADRHKKTEERIGDFYDVLGGGDSRISLGLLGEILGDVAGNPATSHAELQTLCLQLVSGAYRAAAEIGDAGRQLGAENKLWEQVLACREEPELLQATVKLIHELCEFIAERKKSHTLVVVQKALEHMNEHYRENLSLRSVAESVYLSPNYLGALFRAELGSSFTDQLIWIRVQKAKEMLLRPELKLYEVAERVGYQNIGYFTGVFKRLTGYSPKEYRDFHGLSNSN